MYVQDSLNTLRASNRSQKSQILWVKFVEKQPILWEICEICLKMISKNGHFHGNFVSKFGQKLICFAQLLIKKDSNFAIFGENDEIIVCSFNNKALKKWANSKAFYIVATVHFFAT